ncbi:CopG family transcriptional regulator [Thermococci archaeon]|nr:MAG: CopG family transcriptional regulator [Thermococci archaeon]
MVKRILVNMPDEVWEVVEENLKGKMGKKNSAVVRNIVVAYLSEKGYFEAGKVQ